jgi:hypothetical protein
MHHERDRFNKSGRRTAIDLPSSPATPCLDPPHGLLVSLLDDHTRRRPRAGGGGGGGMGQGEAAGQRSRAPGKGGPREIQVRVVFSPFRLMSPSSSSATARQIQAKFVLHAKLFSHQAALSLSHQSGRSHVSNALSLSHFSGQIGC